MQSFLFFPNIPLSSWTILEALRWNHLFGKCWKMAGAEIIVQLLLSFWHQFGEESCSGSYLWVSLQGLLAGVKAEPGHSLSYPRRLLPVGGAWFAGISDLTASLVLQACSKTRAQKRGRVAPVGGLSSDRGLQISQVVEITVCVRERQTTVAKMKFRVEVLR